MSESPSALTPPQIGPAVAAEVEYLVPGQENPKVMVYALASGRPTLRPQAAFYPVTVQDMRPLAGLLSLDRQGFELHTCPTAFQAFYDEAAVREHYYPEVAHTLRGLTGALEVLVFDHNVRSDVRAQRGQAGVRVPVSQAHNDYTEESGPRRREEVLREAGREDLLGRRVALINLWRPIIGPVQDKPLGVCSARSVAPEDLVATQILHFGDSDLEAPRHRGQIYSVLPNPQHEWYYAPQMQPWEVLLLKGYDSRRDGRARFMPHTGFSDPTCPAQFTPRESIEARAVVVFNEPW